MNGRWPHPPRTRDEWADDFEVPGREGVLPRVEVEARVGRLGALRGLHPLPEQVAGPRTSLLVREVGRAAGTADALGLEVELQAAGVAQAVVGALLHAAKSRRRVP